jgi:hypothetical protein
MVKRVDPEVTGVAGVSDMTDSDDVVQYSYQRELNASCFKVEVE